MASGQFVRHWLASWLIAWIMMLPVVVLAAPAIRSLAVALTREEPTRQTKAVTSDNL
jgi:hypothetical protein